MQELTRLLEDLEHLARAPRLSPFVISMMLKGLEQLLERLPTGWMETGERLRLLRDTRKLQRWFAN